MGVVISTGEKDLWEPSLSVGRLFLDQVTSLERLTGLESGVSPIASDEVQIDPRKFKLFIHGCLRMLERTNNAPLYVLSEGGVKVGIALYHEMFGAWPEVSSTLASLLTSAKTVMSARLRPHVPPLIITRPFEKKLGGIKPTKAYRTPCSGKLKSDGRDAQSPALRSAKGKQENRRTIVLIRRSTPSPT
jgi:hypothetical protein